MASEDRSHFANEGQPPAYSAPPQPPAYSVQPQPSMAPQAQPRWAPDTPMMGQVPKWSHIPSQTIPVASQMTTQAAPPAPPTQVIQRTEVAEVTRGCRHCGGELDESCTDTGVLWAICCFPWGLICLLGDRETKCVNCGLVQGSRSAF